MSTVARRNTASQSHSRHASFSSFASSPKLPNPASPRANVRTSYESQGRTSFETRASLESNQDNARQRLVLTDTIALRFLEDDPSVTVTDYSVQITGYECYVVEQWATARAHPTFAITNFTGDHNDKVTAAVVSIPLDETAWSPGLRAYFKALNRYHARRRDTSLGFIMTISISAFPSSLTVIRIPDGDLARYRVELLVNENLKRLGCSGRTGLTFVKPNSATIAKYHQLYRTSEKCPINDSVLELVKTCQIALHLFDCLASECVDGLLCDLTERAINEWWTAIGSEIYTQDPHDGILGPTTVAAIIGCLLGARNRLHALGASVPKDPFDLDEMKRGISRFQKAQRILRTRRLDRQTMLRLHKASEKAAHSEGWSVPKAVKSTVAELSGKGGEMIADAVARRDKTAIADIETVDIDVLQDLVYGERCKWLWHGKTLKNTVVGEATIEGRLILKDDGRSFTWTALKAVPEWSAPPLSSRSFHLHRPRLSDSSKADQEPRTIKPGVRKRATNLLTEGRTNLDRFRDVVHLRGHQARQSIDETPQTPPRPGSAQAQSPVNSRPAAPRSYTSPSVEHSPTKASHWLNQALRRADTLQSNANFGSAIWGSKAQHEPPSPAVSNSNFFGARNAVVHPLQRPRSKAYEDLGYLDNALPGTSASQNSEVAGTLLRKTMSCSSLPAHSVSNERPDLPRYLSYSIADVKPASSFIDEADISDTDPNILHLQMLREKLYLDDLQSCRAEISHLSRSESVWVNNQLSRLESLLMQTSDHASYVDSSLQDPTSQLSELRARCGGIIRNQKEVLGETAREIGTLASKLDYEITSLQGKVDDIDLGLVDFERGVKGVERSADELERALNGRGTWSCVVS